MIFINASFSFPARIRQVLPPKTLIQIPKDESASVERTRNDPLPPRPPQNLKALMLKPKLKRSPRPKERIVVGVPKPHLPILETTMSSWLFWPRCRMLS